MGIFDKKKKSRDDFDSPVETIDLTADDPTELAGSRSNDFEDSVDDDIPAVEMEAAPPPAASTEYGIDDAIALMRTLPQDNVELVVQVVKHTLESARIDIGRIIEDATDKNNRIESRVGVLKRAIDDLEREIASRKKEIASLEADHKETSTVKERLVLAQNLAKKSAEAKTKVQTGKIEEAGRNAKAKSDADKPAEAKSPSGSGPEHPTTRAKSLTGAPPPRPGSTNPPPISDKSGEKKAGHTVVKK